MDLLTSFDFPKDFFWLFQLMLIMWKKGLPHRITGEAFESFARLGRGCDINGICWNQLASLSDLNSVYTYLPFPSVEPQPKVLWPSGELGGLLKVQSCWHPSVSNRTKSVVGETAGVMKSLLCKPKDPSSVPMFSCAKGWGGRIQCPEGGDKWAFGVHWPDSLAYWVRSRPARDFEK